MILLVDFENVDERGLKGVETLRETDRLIIFHNGTNKMTFGMHKRLAESRCRTEYIELKDRYEYCKYHRIAYEGS